MFLLVYFGTQIIVKISLLRKSLDKKNFFGTREINSLSLPESHFHITSNQIAKNSNSRNKTWEFTDDKLY